MKKADQYYGYKIYKNAALSNDNKPPLRVPILLGSRLTIEEVREIIFLCFLCFLFIFSVDTCLIWVSAS